MKRIIMALLFVLTFCLSAKDLNVLMIGNSFSICVGNYLPKIVKSVPGCRLTLTSAYIGGCSLEKHSGNLTEAEKNPEASQYRINVWYSDKPNVHTWRGNVLKLLKTEKYDVITIQQNSFNSFKYNTYQPYADHLISVIRKYQPQAEIVIQQTWSYRSDSWILTRDKLSNTEMYQGAASAYRKLAESHGLRVIPMGDAVQIFRKNNPPPEFKYLDNKARAKYKWPDVPPQAGDVVGVNRWIKQGGRMVLYMDSVHLNERGEYLQAAVWFAFLYGRKTSEIKFVPLKVGDDDAVLLRKYAQEAVDNYKQVAK